MLNLSCATLGADDQKPLFEPMCIVFNHMESLMFELDFSNSLIIREAKTKENHKCDGFGNVIKHFHKLAKLSPSFSPQVRICLRSCIKHSH